MVFRLKAFVHNRWVHLAVLIVWMGIGASIRFTWLTSKPLWTDEFATLVFSLGQSFRTIPLDQAIALDVLLQPLRFDPQLGVSSVVQRLLSETVHPPLYFVLAHEWMRLFLNNGELVSLWVARSLPVLLGVFSIPAIFGLTWVAFQSPLASQLAAAIMAVSPFGIFLAQEARHYTMAILWVIASLSCFMVAIRRLQAHRPIPLGLAMLWIGVNGLGIATHFFILLTLASEAVVLLGMAGRQLWSGNRQVLGRSPWRRIYGVTLGTVITGSVWIPIWSGIRSHEVTQWIQNNDPFNFASVISPFFQALAAWITMLVLLPVEAPALSVIIISGIAMGIFLVWVVPILVWGLRTQNIQPQTNLAVQGLGGVVLAAIALFFLITYGLGTDLTRGARYNFVYYPAVIVLLGGSLAAWWPRTAVSPDQPSFDTGAIAPSTHIPSRSASSASRAPGLSLRDRWMSLYRWDGKRTVAFIWLIGLLSGLTVVGNLGYRKYYRPDLLVPFIQANSPNPVLIATTHNTHVQTGEMMGLGWEFHHRSISDPVAASNNPSFLLAHTNIKGCQENCVPTTTLHQSLALLPRPLDLWLVNFHEPPELHRQQCEMDPQLHPYVSGYDYRHYRCE